jgi:hypothetical protein
MEFMTFFLGGLNSVKIQTIFKSDVASKFCNSKSGEILDLGQKGKLLYFKLSSVLTCLILFGHQEVCGLDF